MTTTEEIIYRVLIHYFDEEDLFYRDTRHQRANEIVRRLTQVLPIKEQTDE